jgi:hypothetical protein
MANSNTIEAQSWAIFVELKNESENFDENFDLFKQIVSEIDQKVSCIMQREYVYFLSPRNSKMNLKIRFDGLDKPVLTILFKECPHSYQFAFVRYDASFCCNEVIYFSRYN